MSDYYKQCDGFAVEKREPFQHIMALTLDPATDFNEGVIRCVVERKGQVDIPGFLDKSQLWRVKKNRETGVFEITTRLLMTCDRSIIRLREGRDFIGFEDPDIVRAHDGLLHLYFTIPFIGEHDCRIHLGHAVGKNLDRLEMTRPVLMHDHGMAKEVSIAPLNSKDLRCNLVESNIGDNSVVRVALASDFGSSWTFLSVVFNPKEHFYPWIAAHASPGPLLPSSFIDVGNNCVLGFINGREANLSDGRYGRFSVGLFLYDYEVGVIQWVSSKPFIFDSEANNITFASFFQVTGPEKGILYCHVDDSFVRAYEISTKGLAAFMATCGSPI